MAKTIYETPFESIYTCVDDWVPRPYVPEYGINQDIIFTTRKGFIIAPISKVINTDNMSSIYGNDTDVVENCYDGFIMDSKKSYNFDDMRNHIVHYLNYFERFYDTNKEYLSILAHMKVGMDNGLYCIKKPGQDNLVWDTKPFLDDVSRYILSPNIISLVKQMVEDNYRVDVKEYKNDKKPSLKYTDQHAKVLLAVGILMNMCIPLYTHFMKRAKVQNTEGFLLTAFAPILFAFPEVDIYAKLRETAESSVENNVRNNIVIWNKQDIRGITPALHSASSIDNIILNIMPKYNFTQSIINLNFTSIRKNTGYKITDIGFEYNFVSLSNSKRDEDNNSEFDRFESSIVKQSESKYLHIKVNSFYCVEQMKKDYLYNREEIMYYKRYLSGDNNIHYFQKELVFNFCYKFFNDTISLRAINNDDYIFLLIATKKMLKEKGMILLPEIIGGSVGKVIKRKCLNRKEEAEFMNTELYPMLRKKYRNDKVITQMLAMTATMISSKFKIIDNDHRENTGLDIITDSQLIIPELQAFVLMI